MADFYYGNEQSIPTVTTTPAAGGNNLTDVWGDFDWSDFASGGEGGGSGQSNSQQYSGLPSWFNTSDIQRLWQGNIGAAGDVWRNAQQGGQVSPATAALIEQQRKLMPQQYASEMQDYYNRQINPMMNSLSNRGVLNSSITGDALAKALRTQAAKQSDQVTQANVWAGNELLKNMGTNQQMNYDTWKNIMSFLPQLLAAIRESTGTSTSEWANESSNWGAPVFPGME